MHDITRRWRARVCALALAAAGLAPGAAHAAPRAAASLAVAAPSRAAIDSALARAGVWLDTLAVDVDTLAAHGIKGRKKLAEVLDAEFDLWRHAADPVTRARLMARVRERVAQTTRSRYHDLLTAPDRELHEDGMSYLRVAWLMERFGLDDAGYRREIAAALPRLRAQLVTRGTWQRREFERYFVAFGIATPDETRDTTVTDGVIAEQLPLERFDLERAYDLTHEVFLRAEDPAGAPPRWSRTERAYLRRTLPVLTRRAFEHDDPDIGAELLTAMTESDCAGDPAFAGGLRVLLATQSADGSWGHYDRDRMNEGRWADQRLGLHTTMVVVDALVAASEMRR